MTASLMYNRPLQNGNWASMLLWGRNQSLMDGNIGTAIWRSPHFSGRQKLSLDSIENVDRTNELLIGENPEPADFQELTSREFRLNAGYDREIGHIPHLSPQWALQVTW